ncbi:MAG: PilZ domain-containing protein [Oleiphilaceae bacterium]|nr:PilZ domain-containing protein [Oleiphilaceae bacterium]
MAHVAMTNVQRNYSEKRNFRRMALNTDIEIHMLDSDKTYPAMCLNLSGAGLMFRLKEPLDKDAIFRTTIKSGTEQTADLTATLRVIRCAPNGPEGYVVGAEIVEFN